jgi:hypothetical protein
MHRPIRWKLVLDKRYITGTEITEKRINHRDAEAQRKKCKFQAEFQV